MEVHEIIRALGLHPRTSGDNVLLPWDEFERLIKSAPTPVMVFYSSEKIGFEATAYWFENHLRVLAGSTVRRRAVPSMPKIYRDKRDHLLDQGVIAERGGELVFVRDELFDTPSEAASVVCGGNQDGLEKWKTADREMLKTIIEQRRSTRSRRRKAAARS